MEQEYNEAVCKLLLYSNKDVFNKADIVGRLMIHSPLSEELQKAHQELIAAMRKDIQIWTCQRAKAEEVNHFYSYFTEVK